MNRNTEVHGQLDTIETPRSTVPRKQEHRTTFNAGKLVPIYFNSDIIPGTTIKNSTTFVVRLQTPLNPTMDNLYLDYYWFRAPKFWYWNHFKEQFGENSQGAWAQTIEYNTPMIKVNTAYNKGDLANYLGVPQGKTNFEYDRMGINFYIDIWNNWFRSQVVQAPVQFDKSDNDLISDGTINTGYGLLPVCKTHDYFTSLLIQPQKGTASTIPVLAGQTAPVVGTGIALGMTDSNNNLGTWLGSQSKIELGTTAYGGNVGSHTVNSSSSNNTIIGVTTDPTKSGLIADLSASIGATINALRFSVANQRILEAQARYGSIYRDTLHLYGSYVNSLDTLIPEYLGGSRVPLQITATTQTSGTTTVSPLGEQGAYSVTVNTDEDFTKSFGMHDMIMCVACVRVAQHTYCQGLPAMFSRKNKLDHYFPQMAFIGNTPVYNREIYLQGNAQDNEVFGYKEAWQEYLYTPNRVSGEMDPTNTNGLRSWSYADDYANLPILGPSWIVEDASLIDRTIAVTSDEADQFWGDFYFEQMVTAPIPLFRTPGLMDHY